MGGVEASSKGPQPAAPQGSYIPSIASLKKLYMMARIEIHTVPWYAPPQPGTECGAANRLGQSNLKQDLYPD